MTPCVMFGFGPSFRDSVDTLHACGGFLSHLVLVSEAPHPEPELEASLSTYQDWLKKQEIHHPVWIIPMKEFTPQSGEKYLVGISGSEVLPLRKKVKSRFGLTFATLVHPGAYVSPMSTLGEGVVLRSRAIVGPNTTVGEFSTLQAGANIGHDGEIGRAVTIEAGASIAGGVVLRSEAVVGRGATVLESLIIGEASHIAAGAVVLRNVPPRVTVAGVPATILH